MRRSVWIVLLLLLFLQGFVSPGCKSPYACDPGLDLYSCVFTATPKGTCQSVCADGGKTPDSSNVCAANKNDAALVTKEQFSKSPWNIEIRYCYPLKGAPAVGYPQDAPSCDPTSADDACVACAKAACCGPYQACSGDALCLCWVGCKYAGNTDEVCAQPAQCGPLDGVSAAAATCLDANCPAQCETMSTMAGACMCGSPGGGGTGGGPSSSCTPGPTGSGEACFSDGDCASCTCDAATMTCD